MDQSSQGLNEFDLSDDKSSDRPIRGFILQSIIRAYLFPLPCRPRCFIPSPSLKAATLASVAFLTYFGLTHISQPLPRFTLGGIAPRV